MLWSNAVKKEDSGTSQFLDPKKGGLLAMYESTKTSFAV